MDIRQTTDVATLEMLTICTTCDAELQQLLTSDFVSDLKSQKEACFSAHEKTSEESQNHEGMATGKSAPGCKCDFPTV